MPSQTASLEVPRPTMSKTATPTRTITCWDGSTPTRTADCSGGQRGLAGLRWVYPSLDLSACIDEKGAAASAGQPDPAPLRQEVWRCPTRFSGGRGEIFYYAWNDGTTDDRLGRYAEKFLFGERRDFRDAAGRLHRVLWLNDESNEAGMYELSSVYVGLPFSMSVYAPTYADLEQALAEMVSFRAPAEMRGARQ